jgi:hypothetical protein
MVREEVAILRSESATLRPKLDLLAAITPAVPNGTVLTEVDIDPKGAVTLRGVAPSIEVVSGIAGSLNESGEFIDAEYREGAQKNGKIAFRISATVH